MLGSMLFTEAVNTPIVVAFALPVNILLNNDGSMTDQLRSFCFAAGHLYPAKPFKSMMASDNGCQVSHKLGGMGRERLCKHGNI